ncbi:hypothetical protein UFOVP422_13 [uncultured Caudovirales phage]|uniref:Uncharacterized protein n=1 Tax=uncultured Caudovirales phage TaxID=2100421 RepID=A0A6J5MDM4_9CAUD|nr:hypothetical protein UFOVP422_13 [uncultured Caudovirales phage]
MAITGFTGQRLGTLQTVALNTSTPATITPPDGADFIIIEVHNSVAHVTFDGTNPTTSVGFKLPTNTTCKIEVGQDCTLKIIATTGTPNAFWQAFKTKKDNDA